MTDDRLRCAIVYRLESSGNGETSVTPLAKYDHASQYESAGSSGDKGKLYGGRDKSYADACGMVIRNDSPGSTSDPGNIGGFKVVQSEAHQVVYGADSEGLCLAVVTGLRYPSRVAIQMLTELYSEFKEKYGLQAKSATTDSLIKKTKPLLVSFCKKYEASSKVDKTSKLIGQVDEVKMQMQDNIASMLQNTEQAETLVSSADQLNAQANVFKKNATDVKSVMWKKDLKMKILIVVLVGGILAVILVPLILRATGK